MKKIYLFSILLMFAFLAEAQAPQRVSYQAIIRNSQGKLMQNSPVGIRLSVLQGSVSGSSVYTETHTASTNANGLVTVEIGGGITLDNFSSINWAAGPYFLLTETDPAGGTNYTVSGVSQLISVPYALYSEKSGDGFSGDYNDLINTPDGSDTKVKSGWNITVSGSGTEVNPYVVSAGRDPMNSIVITSSQSWTVPADISHVKVELWGGAGGGGGAGAGSYSYSYNLTNGGDGGSGGYAMALLNVTPNQNFNITIGNGGYAGNNAFYNYPYWYGDTNGGNGGDTYFGSNVKAAGGFGGYRGSYSPYTVNGEAGTTNLGDNTGYAEPSNSNILSVFPYLHRSYINDRILTSKPGTGGKIVSGYSEAYPKTGEAGCAIISFW